MSKVMKCDICGKTVYNHKIVVIGNVFDNSDLLEGGEEE